MLRLLAAQVVGYTDYKFLKVRITAATLGSFEEVKEGALLLLATQLRQQSDEICCQAVRLPVKHGRGCILRMHSSYA